MKLSPETVNFLISMGIQVLAAVAILVAGWIIAGWAARLVRKRAERSPVLDKTLAIVAQKLTRALILTITVIAVLNQFGVQTASLIALLGAAGLAIGLALQGSLANFASGVMIIAFRPFKVGDFVDRGFSTTQVLWFIYRMIFRIKFNRNSRKYKYGLMLEIRGVMW